MAAAFLASVARLGYAQTSAGLEFQVNTYTTGVQGVPVVAADASGNFVVVWESAGQDGNGYGIIGQRFAASGTRLGSEFQVNAYTTADQRFPSVASDANGNLVVVWGSDGQDGSGDGVFGRRFAASGAPLGNEFQVNSYTTATQRLPSVASDANGNF